MYTMAISQMKVLQMRSESLVLANSDNTKFLKRTLPMVLLSLPIYLQIRKGNLKPVRHMRIASSN